MGAPFNLKLSTATFRAGLLLASTAISADALAQVPSSVDPSHLEQRFNQPTTQAPVSNITAPAPKPAEIPAKLQAQMAKKRFVLKSVKIEGSTVYSPDQLKFAYANELGHEISLVDAQHIVQRITDLYHHDDYILSQAIVPPQSIEGGVLRIRIVEGFISDVKLTGDIKENSYRKIVESYADNIKGKRPIKTADLERYLLLINDLPGASAKGLVRPSPKTFGGAELDITVSHKTFGASYTLDNRGTKFVGPWQHTGVLTANSLFGMYDRTLLRVVTTAPMHELQFYDLQHEEQIGSEGTRAIVDVSHSRTLPGDAIHLLGINGQSDAIQAKVLHPFIRSRQENLVGRAIFDYRDTDTDVFKNVDFTEDRLRVLRAGGNYDFADKLLGVNLIDAQVSQGLSIFNASRSIDAVSNPKADGTFTKVNMDVTRTQALPRNFSLLAAASGQYSFDPLLAAEQFTLGGVGFGQAYDPAELAGDHGLAGKLELRYGQALNDYYINSYQLYSYYDIGRVWLREAAAGANDKKSLASTGIGIRTNFSENISSNLEVGMPLTKRPSNAGGRNNEPRFFFSTTGRF